MTYISPTYTPGVPSLAFTTGGVCYSGDPGYGTLPCGYVSRHYRSQHNVEAIQFSVAQTPPVEIIPHHLFSDVEFYAGYPFTDPAGYQPFGDARLSYDPFAGTVIVNRSPSRRVNVDHGLIRSPLAPVMKQDAGVDLALYGGGIMSPVITPSPLGRCYLAASIIPVKDLGGEPVYLQLWDADQLLNPPPSGEVEPLKEWPLSAGVGQRIRTVQPFNIGEYAPPGTTFVVSLVQPRSTAVNSWAVEGLSFYDEGAYWEFSVDGGQHWLPALGIKNNRFGILNFQNPGNDLMWRVTFTQWGISVTDMTLRPVYEGDPFNSRGYSFRGPNLEFTDVFSSVLTDPAFQSGGSYLPGTLYKAIGPTANQVLQSGPIQLPPQAPPVLTNRGQQRGVGLPLPVPAEPAIT